MACGLGSVVCIATGYGLDGPGSKAMGDTMGASKRRYLQDTTTDNPDLTRFHGLSTQIQVENDVP